MAEETPGFLSRWARRKADVRQGKPLDEPALVAKPVPIAGAGAAPAPPGSTEPVPAGAPSSGTGAAEQPETKTLSLDDVRLLTQDSDFKPFMAGKVGPEVRNAAMKKLFADPHFNVMDGLDIYIDDYSKSDPIPESMLRQMSSAKFLGLFDDDEDAEKQNDPAASLQENSNNPTDEIVAQSGAGADTSSADPISPENASQAASLADSGASQEDHDHTDLQLQPDHAAPAPGAGRGT